MRTRWLLALIITLCPAVVLAGEWPGFRGAGGSVSPARGLPSAWSPTEGIAWSVELPGYGQSSPVVWGETVYVTAVSGASREKGHVLALDLATGAERWRHELEPTQKMEAKPSVSRGAPTPCVDAAGVYCFFEGGDLLALTHEGTLRWARSLVTDYGAFAGRHGMGGSPCQTDEALFVLIDHDGPSYLLSVSKADGKTRWKADRPEAKMSWTSPVVAEQGGKAVIVASSNGSVTGYAAADGRALWRVDGFVGNTIPSATVAGEAVLVGAGKARRGAGKDIKSNLCLTLTDGDEPGVRERWAAKAGISNFASPLAYEGHAYFVNSVGALYCYDLASGELRWVERIEAGPCWASPVGADGRVWCFGRGGVTTVLKAGPTFEVVGSSRLWEEKPEPEKKPEGDPNGPYGSGPKIYGVAVVDGAFVVRTGTRLIRIGVSSK